MKFRNTLMTVLMGLCVYNAAWGVALNRSTFNFYDRHLGIARPETYTGGYLLPGRYEVQAMSTNSFPGCSGSGGSFCAEVDARQATYSGGILRVTTGGVQAPFPGTAGQTCSIWGINAVAFFGQHPHYYDEPSQSLMFPTASDAVDPNRSAWAFISVSERIEVPFSCYELVSGPKRSFDLAYPGENYYIATSSTRTYENMYYPYFGGGPSIKALGPDVTLSLQSNALLCNSSTWSKGDCMLSRYAGWYDFGTGGGLTPIEPAQCELSGSTTLDFGTISKKDAIGESLRTVLTIQCSKNATVRMQILDSTLSKEGLEVGIAFGDTDSVSHLQNVGKTPVEVSVVAQIKGIAETTPAGEYAFSTPLVVTYY
ncbi:hypothetical protein [Providencia sp. Je.9.19]|uniref:hypothetical protein n=1 Tax=unclassified Providencia TaxID=2633465 RepID=UPI003DAA4D8B